MAETEWTEVVQGEEYRAEIDGVTYGVRWKPAGWWVWTTTVGNRPMETGECRSADEAKAQAESYAQKLPKG